jgi:anti-sigma factor RsiW
MNHLNEEQFALLLAATARDLRESAPDSELGAVHAHASQCPECAAELTRMRDCIELFREASTAHADAHLTRLPAWQPPARRSFVLQPGYWAAVAAAALIAALIPLQIGSHHRPQPPAQQPIAVAPQHTPAESDEALLESVNRELSESVPTPMAALVDPTASGTHTSQNSSQRTN